MVSKLLKATHGSDKTPLHLGNLEIPCYVLEDGTRVFSGRGIQKALGANPKSSGTWLNKFINESSLTEYLNPGVLDQINTPIKFERPGAGGSQSVTFGYEVTLLIDICDSILEAEKSRANIPDNISKNAQIIIRSVAKVGIIALVDEVTGYQYDREKDALQVVLKAYINDELLKWQQKFPDSFYFEIFRLNKWDYTVTGIKKRPGVIGTWTNELIYKQLPKGVLDELKSKTPKSVSGNYTARFFQSLTPDIGHPALTAQIYKVIGIMSISNTWEEFKNSFNRMIDRANGQIELNFDEIQEIIEKGELPLPKTKSLSDFNKKLQQGLNFNPKENN